MARRSTRGPCAAVSRGRQAAQRESTGEGMDARVEAAQERLPDVLSKSPAPAHGLAAHGDRMDAGVEATQERCPMVGKRQAGWPFSFTPGILPYALRASRSEEHTSELQSPLN